jgi:hypothetical protein
MSMDVISSIVTALAIGAAAALHPRADQALKDSYANLKRLIQSRYPQVNNPSCHLLNPRAVSCKLGVKQPFHPSEEEAHGRQNYNDVLPM